MSAQRGLRVRLARPDDAVSSAAIYAPYVRDTAISFETEPPDAAEVERRITKTLSRWAGLVCEDGDGRVLAYAFAGPYAERASYRWSAAVSVYVAPDHVRRGLGRALYSGLLPLLARQGFHTAFAGITVGNLPSEAMHRTLGFEPVGRFPQVGHKLGRWHDVAWYRRVLVAHDGDGPCAAPPETLCIDEVLATAQGQAALAAAQACLPRA